MSKNIASLASSRGKKMLLLLENNETVTSQLNILKDVRQLREEKGSNIDALIYEPSTSDVGNKDPHQPNNYNNHIEDIRLEDDLYLSNDSLADPNWEDPFSCHNMEEMLSDKDVQDELENDNGEVYGEILTDKVPSMHNQIENVTVVSKKIKTSRWHKRRENTYKRNKEKVLRSQCLPYRDYKGALKPGKAPIEFNCNCKFGCLQNFSEEDRRKICETYWNLGDYARQKDFILSIVKSACPKRRLINASKHRNITRIYFLQNKGLPIRMCQNFFEKTNISNGPINKAFSQTDNTGTFVGKDNRGKHPAHNKTKDSDLSYVKEYIESFPTMESHYCRVTFSKLYLDSSLSIIKMYNLYLNQCSQNSRKAVSVNVYRKVFCTDYNLDFHKPKKDQCLLCHKYNIAKNTDAPDLPQLTIKYENHIDLKNKSYQAKEKDKIRANEENSFTSITLDLQKVLNIPSDKVSPLYYLRKLYVFNASIYKALSPNNVYCIMWSEINGKKRKPRNRHGSL